MQLSAADYTAKWNLRFATNDQFVISEADFREFSQDTADSFAVSGFDIFTGSAASPQAIRAGVAYFVNQRQVWLARRSFNAAAQPTASANWGLLLDAPPAQLSPDQVAGIAGSVTPISAANVIATAADLALKANSADVAASIKAITNLDASHTVAIAAAQQLLVTDGNLLTGILGTQQTQGASIATNTQNIGANAAAIALKADKSAIISAVNNLTTTAASNITPPAIDAVNNALSQYLTRSDYANKYITTSNGLTTAYSNLAAALATSDNSSITRQQCAYNIGSGALTVTGGVLDLNGGIYASGGITHLQPGSLYRNGIHYSNGGVGSVVSDANGGGSGGLFGAIIIQELRLCVSLTVNSGTTVVLDGVTMGAHYVLTLSYSGTLIIEANSSLVNVNLIATPVSGQPAPVLIDRRPVTTSAAGGDTYAVLTYAAVIALDFNAATVQTLAATGNVVLTTASRALLKTKQVTITNTTAADITISYEAWSFLGLAPVAKLPAGKKLKLTVQCLGPAIGDVEAANVLFV